jgi:hypothetical protein
MRFLLHQNPEQFFFGNRYSQTKINEWKNRICNLPVIIVNSSNKNRATKRWPLRRGSHLMSDSHAFADDVVNSPVQGHLRGFQDSNTPHSVDGISPSASGEDLQSGAWRKFWRRTSTLVKRITTLSMRSHHASKWEIQAALRDQRNAKKIN